MGKLEEVAELKAKLEKAEAEAKEEQRNIFKKKMNEANTLAAKFRELFGEDIDTKKKKNKPAKEAAKSSPISLDEIKAFIAQKTEGKEIVLKGRRKASIKKIEEAYEVADTKDAESVMALLA